MSALRGGIAEQSERGVMRRNKKLELVQFLIQVRENWDINKLGEMSLDEYREISLELTNWILFLKEDGIEFRED